MYNLCASVRGEGWGLSLPTYNSTSEMFAVQNIPSFGQLLKKFAFRLMTRIASSMNSFMVNIYSSSVPMFFSTI